MPSFKVTGNVSLTDDQVSELQAQVGIYYNHAIGYHQGELGVKARTSWEYYYGRLPEAVTQGSSTWVDRTVWECVNGVVQELTSVFTSGENAVRFTPMHSRDAGAARASTKLVNQILIRDNPGYAVLNDAFKEACVTRNSFVKRYWHTSKELITESFEDFTKEEVDLYLAQLDGEIVEATFEEVFEDEEPTGMFYGEILYEREKEGVKIEFVPFEQVIVEPTATSLHDCNYIAHRVRKSKDELLEMGFDPESVRGYSPASSDIEAGVIANARINNLSPLNVSDVLSVGDDHADKLWLHENYIKTSIVSGRLEILQVFTLHNQIIEVNRVNEFPFETFTPFPIPGTIWGESIPDITRDIQDLKTNLFRGVIDNIMNANFRRYKAVKGGYDRQSLLNNRPGGVVEMDNVNNVIPFEYHQLPGGIVDLINLVDASKEMRTGVSKIGQGLDPAVFKNDNAFATVNLMMSAAQNRLRMIARNIAYSGMMNLMKSIYELVRQNGTKKILVETPQGMIDINPRELPPRHDMVVSVAIGDSERKERAASLQAVMMMFNQVPQMTKFFQDGNAYMLATQTLEAMGIYDTESFITPLDQLPPPQPNPAEELQLKMLQEQISNLQTQTQKLVAEVQSVSQKAEFEQIKTADDIDMRRQESLSRQDEAADKQMLAEREFELKVWDRRIEERKLDIKEQELLLEAQLEAQMNRPVGLGRS